jgi:CHAT domain-containing protein/tetratricopeptide (TPR) repeat protein
MSAPELNSSRPPLPASGFPALWYHEPLNLPFERSKPPFTRAAGSRHDDLDPSCEVGVNGPQAWAVLSLSLAGFALAGCDPRAGAARPREHRSVEPRLSDVPLYVRCRTEAGATDLVPDTVCAAPPPPGAALKGQRSSVRTRGGSGTTGPRVARVSQQVQSGRLDELDRAVETLARAAADDPHRARSWSDLSAAYLVRAQRADDPRDLVRALTAADRAVREDGSLPEARFNRALSLERLFLRAEARAAWRGYLALDKTSPWAREARERLAGLTGSPEQGGWREQRERLDRAASAGETKAVETIVGHWPQAAREHGEDELLGQWADAVAQGGTELAMQRLRTARALGDALVRISGERLLRDAVAAINAAERDAGRLRLLAQGHRDFRDGRALYKERKPEASAKLGAARDALVKARSPFAARAVFFLACADYVAGRYEQSLARLESLAREVSGRPYPGLLGHLWQMQALGRATQGRMMEAIDANENASAQFRRLGEEENVAALEGALGESLALVGNGRGAWEQVYRALRATPKLRDPGTRSMVFMTAANLSLRDGAFETALVFQREAVRCGLRANPLRAIETLTWLGRIQDRLGQRRLALATLREAGRQAARLNDPGRRLRKAADLGLMEGSMIWQTAPHRAVSLLSSALAIYTAEKNEIFSLWTFLARARAYERLGDDARAGQDLDRAIAIYDHLGRRLQGEDLRLSFLTETDDVFSEMISFQARRNPELALAYADRARTRVLPGSASKLWTGGPESTGRLLTVEPQPLGLDEIRRRLPENTVLIQFAVLPDRVLIWRLQRDEAGERFTERPISEAELIAKVAMLRRSKRPKPADRSPEADLFDLLIRPWLGPADVGKQLVLVPDRVLHRLPFAALWDRGVRRFLVEDHPLAIAPSATLYVNAVAKQREAPGLTSARGLVVGEPAVDREQFPNLYPLPGAAAEATRLSVLTSAVPLVGKAADKMSFVAAARSAEWIHFAGHAVIDPRNMLLSKLVLAPPPKGGSGALTAREIYSLDLRRTRLVVLAACDTGLEYVPGSEGATSLARAFLAAGVPTVVASLWDTADQPTAALLTAFHHHLLAGDDPARALRKAQLGLLHASSEADRSPAAWGAFEVIGASAR